VRRIVVLGCAGSGKTVFARRVAERIGQPAICLDDLVTQLGAEHSTPALRDLIAATHAGNGWVSDGNFAQVSFDLRLPRAELVVWLERSRAVCLWRAMARVLRRGEAHKGRDLHRVLTYIRNFDRINRPIIEAELRAHGAHVPVAHLSGPQVGDFLETLPPGEIANGSI
jgi:adenylate kinase family enzyme